MSDQVMLIACRNFNIFGWLSVIYSLKVDQPKQQKLKIILQMYVIYISDQITVPYLNIETGSRRLNIGGWYVFARRKGLNIYFFFTNSLNYVKYFLTIWWNRHRRFQCKENMTVNAPIFLTTGAFDIVLHCTSLYA